MIAAAMRKGFALIVSVLLVMAWRNRNNMAVFFLLVGTLFAVAAMLVSELVPETIIQALALGWALCMLVAGVSAIAKLAARLRKKKAKHPRINPANAQQGPE
jgi:hypothetical protein